MTREGYACIMLLDKNASHDDNNDDEHDHYDDDALIEDANGRDADIKINRSRKSHLDTSNKEKIIALLTNISPELVSRSILPLNKYI